MMTNNKKGFTLLELLIAATIIGILAMFATVSYKSSQADVRVAGAKARAEMLAGAVQRWNLDHPAIWGLMKNSSSGACSYVGGQGETTGVQNLIRCGYVENGGWEDGYFWFYVCKGKSGNCSQSPIDSPQVCMTGTEKLRDSRYDDGYWYCLNVTNKGERFGN